MFDSIHMSFKVKILFHFCLAGSTSLQCDAGGSCPCREGVTGRRCDRCAENRYDKKAGCKDCPPCYTLVQMAVDEHRVKLSQIQKLLSEISNNRTLIEDANFESELRRVQSEVNRLLEDTKRSAVAVAGET
jgi:coxsackievirus/adenovirus receptor